MTFGIWDLVRKIKIKFSLRSLLLWGVRQHKLVVKLLTLQDTLSIPPSGVKQSVFLDYWTLEDGTNRLCQSISN